MKALVTVVAIAVLLAVAYALWSEQSQISVNAQTGYIDLDFKVEGNPWQRVDGLKDYLVLDYTLLGSEEGNDGPPVLILKLGNLFPFGYEGRDDGRGNQSDQGQGKGQGKGQGRGQGQQRVRRYIVFDSLKLVNDGTIPVKITGCNFTYVEGSFKDNDVDYRGWLELDVDLHKGNTGPPSDVVLRPGEFAIVKISIWVSDDAPEETSVTVKFTCNYVQAVP